MNSRTYHYQQSAYSPLNMGSIRLHNFPPNRVPNAFLLTRDFFPKRETYTTAGKRVPQASSREAPRNTLLQQPQWHSYKTALDTRNHKPRPKKRVHFTPTPQPSAENPASASPSIFFAIFFIFTTISQHLSSAYAFFCTSCLSLPETWVESWYPWLKNVWTSFRAGYKVRPIPKADPSVRLFRDPLRQNGDYYPGRYYPPRRPQVPHRKETLPQILRRIFTTSLRRGRQSALIALRWCLQASSTALSLLAYSIAHGCSLLFACACRSLVLPRRTIAHTSQASPSTPTTVRPATNRAQRRRRQPIAVEQNSSSSSLAASTQPSAPAPVSAPVHSIFQSLISVPRQFPRPKSLQHAQNWLASSFITSSQAPSNPQLPRIDLQVVVGRKSLRNFHQFCEYFQYELRVADSTNEEEREVEHRRLQNDMQKVYDNPVLRVVDGKIRRADSPDQPAQVVHQLYWQGDKELVHDVLNIGLGNVASIQKLSIHHCSLALSDVVAMLVKWPSLDSLEIRDVVSNEKTDILLPPPRKAAGTTYHADNLAFLTLTSRTPLDELFEDVEFPGITSLSLQLHEEGNHTDFDALQPALCVSSSRRSRPFESFKLRSRQSSLVCSRLQAWLADDVYFDFGHIQ